MPRPGELGVLAGCTRPERGCLRRHRSDENGRRRNAPGQRPVWAKPSEGRSGVVRRIGGLLAVYLRTIYGLFTADWRRMALAQGIARVVGVG